MRLARALVPALLLPLAACVTINIYFPAAAAEKAADKILDEVWQKADKAEKAHAPDAAARPAEPAK